MFFTAKLVERFYTVWLVHGIRIAGNQFADYPRHAEQDGSRHNFAHRCGTAAVSGKESDCQKQKNGKRIRRKTEQSEQNTADTFADRTQYAEIA